MGTKLELLKILSKDGNNMLIENFGKDSLDSGTISLAEKFLVKVVSRRSDPDCSTFTGLRIAEYQQFKLLKKKLAHQMQFNKTLKEHISKLNYGLKLHLEMQLKLWMLTTSAYMLLASVAIPSNLYSLKVQPDQLMFQIHAAIARHA